MIQKSLLACSASVLLAILVVVSCLPSVMSSEYESGGYGGGNYAAPSGGDYGNGAGGGSEERPRIKLNLGFHVPAMKIHMPRMNMPKITIRAKVRQPYRPTTIYVPEIQLDSSSKLPGPQGSQPVSGHGSSYGGSSSSYGGSSGASSYSGSGSSGYSSSAPSSGGYGQQQSSGGYGQSAGGATLTMSYSEGSPSSDSYGSSSLSGGYGSAAGSGASYGSSASAPSSYESASASSSYGSSNPSSGGYAGAASPQAYAPLVHSASLHSVHSVTKQFRNLYKRDGKHC